MKNRSMFFIAVTMAFIVILVNCIALILAYYTKATTFPIALIATGVVAFVSLVLLCEGDSPGRSLTEQTMRTAVSGTMVLVYLVLISYSTFNLVPEQQSPLAGTLITNFSAIVGVVIASYFGASAYVQARNKGTKTDDRTDASSRPADKGA